MTERIDIGGPRLSSDQVADMIARELPGVQFDIVERDETDMIELRLFRQVEALRYALSASAAYVPGELNASTQHAVDTVRRKATNDYGLTPYIERLKREAADAARAAFVEALKRQAEQFREQIPTLVEVYEDDGSGDHYTEQSFVWGDLPREVSALLDWAAKHARVIPVTEPNEK